MIAFFLIILEGMFNAVMDSVETTIAFKKSIFKNKNSDFWCKAISAHFAKFIPGTRFRYDAWHLAKFLQIVCFGLIFLGLLLWPEISLWPIDVNWLYVLQDFTAEIHWLLQVLFLFIYLGIYGALRNSSFNIFYNHIFNVNNRKI